MYKGHYCLALLDDIKSLLSEGLQSENGAKANIYYNIRKVKSTVALLKGEILYFVDWKGWYKGGDI